MLGSQDAYRRLYQSRSHPRYVAEFFLRQPEAPHGLFYLARGLKEHLVAIRRETDAAPSANCPENVAQSLLDFLEQLRPGEHFSLQSDSLPPLDKRLAELLDRLYGVHPVLSDHYFSHQARIAPGQGSGRAPVAR
jgi:uncharacterized alpha-E superfamily protein